MLVRHLIATFGRGHDTLQQLLMGTSGMQQYFQVSDM
jgi:hypothetical protein